MNYGHVDQIILKKLREIVGVEDLILDKEERAKYANDESSVDPILPELVIKPESSEEVSQILMLANENRIPVTPRGGGTGLCGGAIPLFGGIILSLEKMNKIIEVDEDNLMATVEPGVFIMDFHAEMEKRGFLYPPDPGQKSATIGGNISTNAGGMKAVKYGVTRDFVEALEVVLPSGKMLKLGGKIVKDATGYSLKDLFIGSEGTLGIVTKATLRLVPLPRLSLTLYILFNNFNDAAKTVSEIIRNKIIPLAIEFVDQASIKVAERYLERPMPRNDAPAYLLIRLDGNIGEEIDSAYEAVGEICIQNGAIDVLVADTREAQEKIWEGRSCIIDAAKAESVIEVLDAVVPRDKVPDLIEGLEAISNKYGIESQNFGHAGDGNVHTNLLKLNIGDKEWNEKIPQMIEEVYKLSISLGGKISGEHGTGIIRKKFLPMALSAEHINLMKGIKKVFDPNNILNPGKIF